MNVLKILKNVITTSIIWLVGLLWTLPLMGILMASIRPYSEIIDGWWRFEKFNFTLENFFKAWNHESFPIRIGFINSFIVTIPSTIIPLIIGALTGYGFARFKFPLRDYFFLFIVLFFAVPFQSIAIPVFRILQATKLLDTYIGLVLVHSSWGIPFATLFMRNFFLTIPIQIEEAAKLDGASDFQIFYKITLPLSLPAMASFSVIQFTWVWSDFFFALLYILSPEKYLATQCLPLLKGLYHTPWDLLSAASVLLMSVPLLIYALFQKYFIRGMIGWAIKG
ncbi:MAG: carbohydrate ABC transporter permease [Candidatus Aenigmatarchaeota archaeon]